MSVLSRLPENTNCRARPWRTLVQGPRRALPAPAAAEGGGPQPRRGCPQTLLKQAAPLFVCLFVCYWLHRLLTTCHSGLGPIVSPPVKIERGMIGRQGDPRDSVTSNGSSRGLRTVALPLGRLSLDSAQPIAGRGARGAGGGVWAVGAGRGALGEDLGLGPGPPGSLSSVVRLFVYTQLTPRSVPESFRRFPSR